MNKYYIEQKYLYKMVRTIEVNLEMHKNRSSYRKGKQRSNKLGAYHMVSSYYTKGVEL